MLNKLEPKPRLIFGRNSKKKNMSSIFQNSNISVCYINSNKKHKICKLDMNILTILGSIVGKKICSKKKENDNRKDVLGNFSNCRMNVLINF